MNHHAWNRLVIVIQNKLIVAQFSTSVGFLHFNVFSQTTDLLQSARLSKASLIMITETKMNTTINILR